mgnify:CR=1 FL=1
MNSSFTVLLVIIPAAAGLICVPLVNRLRACRVVGVLGFGLNLGLALSLLATCQQSDGGAIVSQMGGWSAPYGISLVFDALSGLMVAAASLVALACLIHAAGSLPDASERRYFHPLVNFMMAGVILSFLTGDLFNLFVAFEIMLMASYGLLVLGRGKAQLAQAYKYVLLNLVASSVFVIAAGMIYGLLGTLNLADMARLTTELAARDALPAGFTSVGVLLLFVFTLKAGVFPLWFWLPDTYPTCPIAITALFGGVLTKVGAYAVARIFPLVFFVETPAGDAGPVLQQIVLIGAVLTMAVGVLGALAFRTLRRSLAMFIIVGVGYALYGVAIGEPGSIGGSVFYMAQSMLVMAAAFLACGLIESHLHGDDLRDGGALQKTHPWLGVLFLIGLLSIAGLPPTSGFYGKFAIIRDALGVGFTWTAIIAIGVGALSILAVLRIWCDTFWGPDPTPAPRDRAARAAALARPPSESGYAAVVLLIVSSLGIGFLPQRVSELASMAGEQVTHPDLYIAAVLGTPPGSPPSAANDQAPRSKNQTRDAAGSALPPAPPGPKPEPTPAFEPMPEPPATPTRPPAPEPTPDPLEPAPPVRPAAPEFHVSRPHAAPTRAASSDSRLSSITRPAREDRP